jgi:hypothetical protein
METASRPIDTDRRSASTSPHHNLETPWKHEEVNMIANGNMDAAKKFGQGRMEALLTLLELCNVK